MSAQATPPSRRTILIGAATLTAAPLMAATRPANASIKLPKAKAHYQTTPHDDGEQCSNCDYYIDGTGQNSASLCEIVAGPVSLTGWCKLYLPKK